MPRTRAAAVRLATAHVLAHVIHAAPAAAQVPSFREVTGHELGERVTYHHPVVC
jgi:hypothetical protein